MYFLIIGFPDLHTLLHFSGELLLENVSNKHNNQPFIVKLSDISDDVSPQYFIAIEQELMIECKNLHDALFSLFAVHVFNIEYHQRLMDFFLFIRARKVLV